MSISTSHFICIRHHHNINTHKQPRHIIQLFVTTVKISGLQSFVTTVLDKTSSNLTCKLYTQTPITTLLPLQTRHTHNTTALELQTRMHSFVTPGFVDEPRSWGRAADTMKNYTAAYEQFIVKCYILAVSCTRVVESCYQLHQHDRPSCSVNT